MFVNSDYLNYKYVVSSSDNYVVLTNTHNVNASWESPTTINTITQYLIPSNLTIEGHQTVSQNRTYQQIDVSDNYWERADCPTITCAGFLNLAFIIFIINACTRLVRRGGVILGRD